MTTQENIDVPLDASKWNGIDRYVEDLPPLSDVAQKLLVEYSKVPQDEVTTHVKKIVSWLHYRSQLISMGLT